MKKCTPEKLANKWIREMQKANFTPDQMLECLKLARKKYESILYTRKRFKELHAIATDKSLIDYSKSPFIKIPNVLLIKTSIKN